MITFKWLIVFALLTCHAFASPLTGENRLSKRDAKDKSASTDSDQSDKSDGSKSEDTGKGGDDSKASASEEAKKKDKEEKDKSDDTSEENEDSDSNSDPLTEEEGDSESASDTKEDSDSVEKKEEDSKSDTTEEEVDSPETSEESDSSSDSSDSDSIESDSSDSSDSAETHNKLLVILLDGVRDDYPLRDNKLRAFPKIATTGVHAEYVKPVFPSNSFPNWYSIATGRYPEKHDMVNNYMYHKKRNGLFKALSQPNENNWWNGAEPIWVTAEKEGRKVAMFWWSGCDVEIRGRRPTSCVPYKDETKDANHDQDVIKQLKKVVDNFKENKIDLAMVYYEDVDAVGHKYGPDARKTKKAVRKVDNILWELMEDIEKENMTGRMNVVIVSDHGMTTANKDIELDKHLDFNDIDMTVGEGALSMLLPEKGKEMKVYEKLRQDNVKGLNVYRKANIPKRLHFKKSSLVLPILVTADEGYLINAPSIKAKVFPDGNPRDDMGHHGYDAEHVEDMRTIMYAFGPDFKVNFKSEPLKQVDHYMLWCDLLGIKAKANDGSWARINTIRRTDDDEESDESSSEENDTEEEDDDEADNGVAPNALNGAIFALVFCLRFIFL